MIQDEIKQLRQHIINTTKDNNIHISIRRKWNKLVKQSKTIYPQYHICEDSGHSFSAGRCVYCNNTKYQLQTLRLNK